MIDEKYLQDWSGTRYGTPCGVALPSSTDEVAALLRERNEARVPVAVQGGRTGVSGGAAPGDGELVLSLERLNQIEEFDAVAGIAVVGAGVVLEDLQRQVEAQGWTFPIDLGSRGSCQIGGNAATNAGGCRVIKYGNTRESILGLEAVLANGAVIGPPNRLVKNNAGYSLSNLMIGSEGTLGVITRLALRLAPLPPARRTALLALADHAAVDKVLMHARLTLRDSLSAFEAMWSDFIEDALRSRPSGAKLPGAFSGRRAALIEVEGNSDAALAELMESFVEQQMEDGLIADAVMSTSSRDAQELWAIRESIPQLLKLVHPRVGFDLGLPTKDYDSFVAAAKARLAERLPGVRSYFFGHAGDGNLHVMVGPCASAEEQRLAETALYELLAPLSTTVTAEHGVGRKKKAYLSRARSQADIEAMKMLKRALDPHCILNPGRIFDPD